MIYSALPGMLRAFRPFSAPAGPNEELRISDALYSEIPSTDFSRQVLSIETPRLIVQRLGPVTWSDLGDCERTVDTLVHCRLEPKWGKLWCAAKSSHGVTALPNAAAASA
jgi:hypothetical protein